MIHSMFMLSQAKLLLYSPFLCLKSHFKGTVKRIRVRGKEKI